LAFELSEALAQPLAVTPAPTESAQSADADVGQLLQRLDQALMSDNQLL
jgi:hypothetical protein